MRAFRVLGALALSLVGVIGVAAPVEAASGPWLQVAAGGNHTCAINTSSSLYCWGLNGFGQVGDGTTDTPRLSLFRVGAAGVWSSVSVGGSHTCGVTKAGNLYCWGHNQSAQAGDGTANSPRLSLFRVGGTGVWSSVSAGDFHTCGTTKAKNLYCWGSNGLAQVGDGTIVSPRLSLFRVGAVGVWSSVDAGSGHTCGITTAANLYCWGNNTGGQIGGGTTSSPQKSLFRVGAAGVWASVSAGSGHTCGITTANNLYCWGSNGFGQVGDGTTNSPRLSLFRVGAAGVWSTLNTGGFHTCGITKAANLYCWGANLASQVGDGTTDTPRLSLFRVGVAGVWERVSAGGSQTCAVATAKDLFCWGNNTSGQTGNGNTNSPRLSLFRVA